MTGELAAYQDSFAAALLADDPLAASPELQRLVRQPGFAVYRNTVLKGCIDALQANYPTIVRLVGEEWFRAAASVHARQHLPSRASMLLYGERFPEFLAAFEPAAELPYLPSVARVDRWWSEAHVAADSPPLDSAALMSLTPTRMAAFGLQVHGAARWGWFDGRPIYTLWSRNRDVDAASNGPVDWRSEGVLLTRPTGPVLCAPLTRGGVALLDACVAGASIEDAVVAALEADRDTDVAALIRQLLQAGAFSRLRPIHPIHIQD